MPDDKNNADAEKLIQRVQKLYSSCKSYSDRGQMTSIMPSNEGGDPNVSYHTFSTDFLRPDQFRFEYRDRYPEGQFGRYVVWRDNAQVRTWYYQYNPKVKVAEDLGLGLAGATGVSRGVAVTIPQLLMPDEINARGLFADVNIEILGREESHERDCLKIQTLGFNPHFVWIEIETGLIIRVEEQQKMSFQSSGFTQATIIGEGDLTIKTIITYRPKINVGIPPEHLEFGEPFAGYGDDVDLIYFRKL